MDALFEFCNRNAVLSSTNVALATVQPHQVKWFGFTSRVWVLLFHRSISDPARTLGPATYIGLSV